MRQTADVIDLADVRSAFADLSDVRPLGSTPSGQKDVLRAKLGDQDVALKLIKAGPSTNERAARELAAIARLQSTFVPKVFSHGERDIGAAKRFYVVEQFISGETLQDRLRRERTLTLIEVLRLADVLLRACEDFERAQLVHRDIKPANLMIDGASKYWVIDFGIVRFLDEPSMTPTANRFGLFTPGYGAPEQMRNLKPQINVRADLFSVGVVLYEALSGGNPYLAGKASVLEVIEHMDKFDLPKLAIPGDAGELGDFVAALTARFPSRRPQTARQALDWFAPIHQKHQAGAAK